MRNRIRRLSSLAEDANDSLGVERTDALISGVIKEIVLNFLDGSVDIEVTEYLRGNRKLIRHARYPVTMVARFIPNKKVYLVADFIEYEEDLGLDTLIIYFGKKHAFNVEDLGLSEYEEETFIEEVIRIAYKRHYGK